jgi:hypothetical protein
MNQFIVEIISIYLDAYYPFLQKSEYMAIAVGAVIKSRSASGASVYLPRSENFKLPHDSKRRVWSGLGAKINNKSIVNILVYTERDKIIELEIAAPFDDLPIKIEKFEFLSKPNAL